MLLKYFMPGCRCIVYIVIIHDCVLQCLLIMDLGRCNICMEACVNCSSRGSKFGCGLMEHCDPKHFCRRIIGFVHSIIHNREHKVYRTLADSILRWKGGAETLIQSAPAERGVLNLWTWESHMAGRYCNVIVYWSRSKTSIKTKYILVSHSMKFLWPTHHSVHMFNEGTANSQAPCHITVHGQLTHL
jgi:hypothetical protein